MYLLGYFHAFSDDADLLTMIDEGRLVEAVDTFGFPDGEKDCEVVEDFPNSDGPCHEVEIDGSKYYITLSRGHRCIGFCKLIGD